MSIHFAPQWVKPIKPSGTSLTPTTENPISLISNNSNKNSNSQQNVNVPVPVPFPALSQNQRGGIGSPTTTIAPNQQPLSYSRVTHTPQSPNFPNDISYFPYQEPNIQNGAGGLRNLENGTTHPFRYSRDQILNLFDENKFKERPIELVEMAEGGGVLVSKSVNRPIGLRDLSEIEKKLLAGSVHPPLPSRRQNTHGSVSNANPNPAEPPTPNGLPSRRAGGFARGEGGAFGGGLGGKIGTIGGGLISPGGLDSKAPGALGGGFGGVGKRLGRVRGDTAEGGADGARTGPNWRPPRTASGSFEGVLGFGTAAPSALSGNPLSPNPNVDPDTENKAKNGEPLKEKVEEEKKEEEVGKFGKGGGPGWGTGQKKWRIAAGMTSQNEGDKTLDVPITNELSSASVIATPSATPVPERDATVLDSISLPGVPNSNNGSEGQAQPEEKQDLGAVEWFYRDPNGQEQGPFTGTTMHDWYSHSYFTDDLPLRRASETSFRPLAELKVATGSAVQPFLSPIRPRQLPPNLPIPIAALQQQAVNGLPTSLPDSFRNLGVSSPVTADPRISPQPPIQNTPQQFNQGFLPERAPYSPAAYGPGFNNGPLGSPAAFGPNPGQGWGIAPGAPGGPRLNGPFGSIGMPSPIGATPLPFMQPQHQQQFFSPQIGSPVRGGDLFSPGVGVGAVPGSPWGMPPHPQHSPAYAPQISHQQQPPQQPAWSTEQQVQQPQQFEQQPNPEIEQAVAEALSPVEPQDQVFNPVAEPENAEEEIKVVEGVASTANEEELVAETPAREASPSPVPEPQVATPAKAPVSVWGQPSSKAPSRKTSISSPAPSSPTSVDPTPAAASAAASKLPPAPSSLPAKPSAPAKQPSTSEPIAAPKTVAPGTPGPTAGTSSGEKSIPSSSVKPAPWAIKDEKDIKTSSSPSLREIQEIETKNSELRKKAAAALAESRSSPAPTSTPSMEEFPTSMSWGLPSSKPSLPTPSATTTPSAPVWGGNDSAPLKKTLKQIQEEEEKRKAKAAQAARASQGTPGLAAAAGNVQASQKRGYADLAAASAPAPAGWTTVGASGKPSASSIVASTTARVVSTPTISKPATPIKPVTSVPNIAAVVGTPKKVNGTTSTNEDPNAPSIEFIRWVKGALNGFKGDVDEFINNVLLSFPIDIPQSQRADTLEIISDGVYANSSTLDGRRFAQEFYTKRKLDSQRASSLSSTNSTNNKNSINKVSSLADILKTQPIKKSDDFGFKVVKGKGKKKN